MTNILSSFIFGLTLAISIGPIAMLIINRSLNCGLYTGVLIGFGAAFADFSYCIIAFVAGSGISAMFIKYELWLHSAAAIVLVLFGCRMFLSALKHRKSFLFKSGGSCKSVFGSTYALTMANPLTIVAFTGFAAQSSIIGFNNILYNSVALFTGSMIIQMAFALFGNMLKKYISNPSVVFYLNISSGVVIAGMGIIRIFQTI